jgi:hypothetical protein
MSNLVVFYKLTSLKRLILGALPKPVTNWWNEIMEQNEAAKEIITNFMREDIEKRMATGNVSSFEKILHNLLTKTPKP